MKASTCQRTVLFVLTLLCSHSLLASDITPHSFPSSTLERHYHYTLYKPDDYDTGQWQYPALYLLHGSGGNEHSWSADGQVQQILDTLIDNGDIPPMMVIMPGSQSWWVDGYNEAARTAFFSDLIPHIESTWNVIPERAGRLVAGLSAGGYGAVNFALEQPELFAAAAAYSPAVYIPLPPSHSSAHTVATYHDEDGQFDPAKWQSLNYTNYLTAYTQQALVVPFFINTGDHDTFNIAYHAAVLFNSLFEHQPEQVEFRVIDGDHEWSIWREGLAESLPYMGAFVSQPIAFDTTKH